MTPYQFTFRTIRRLYSNYERSRSYPVRRQVWDYQFGSCERQDGVYLIVAAGDQVNNAAWAAASFLTYSKLLRERFTLVFCLDSLADPQEDEKRLRSSFPQAQIVTMSAVLSEPLEDFPRLERFADSHPMGRKLACLVAFNQRSDVLYSDTDVLAFAPPIELEEAINEIRPTYLGQAEPSYDQASLARIQSEGLEPPQPPLNAGLVYSPKGRLRGELANRLVPNREEMDSSSPTWWWIEQTILSALFGSMGARVLPLDRYIVSLKRQLPFEEDVDYSKICARHFVSPVRHLMYKKGIPVLLEEGRRDWKLRSSARG